MAAYLGGMRITRAHWLGPNSLRIAFATAYGSLYYYQLYAGRTRIGVTPSPAARAIVTQLVPSRWPQPLQLVAVDAANRMTDYGPSLPIRPYNRLKLQYSASSWPADAEYLEVTAGTAPGGAVDADNVLIRQKYDVDRQYAFTTRPLAGGTWNFEVAGRDDKPPDGNVGTALAIAGTVLAHPPDVALRSDGERFAVSVASQTLTVDFEYQ